MSDERRTMSTPRTHETRNEMAGGWMHGEEG